MINKPNEPAMVKYIILAKQYSSSHHRLVTFVISGY